MKILERYPVGYRILSGRGVWKALYPVRFVLAGLYQLWLAAPGRGGGAHGSPRVRERPPVGGRRAVIVSIGNLEVGGGGKTPCAMRLAEAITGRGGFPVVVSRGYRSVAERHAPCVVPAGRELREGGSGNFTTGEALLARSPSGPETLAHAARVLGDEILLYRSRGIPAIIDPDRGRGASLARRLFSPTHILLDDAFQNRSIEKDFEILLLDAERPFGGGRLLPLGTLREGPAAARRADVILFTRAQAACVPREAEEITEGRRVFFSRHEPRDLVGRGGEVAPLSRLDARECILFSGIAHPDSFERMVLSLGARPRAAFRFVDHHEYSGEDVRAVLGEGTGIAPFVTTEKDWVKACELFPADAEVLAVRMEMRIDGLDALLDLLFSSSF